MFHSHKHDDATTGDRTGTHMTNTAANVDPRDHSQGVNAGYGTHSTQAGAALDPRDHTVGINSNNNTTGYGNTGYGHNGATSGTTTGAYGHGQNDHATRTGAALDPTDHSRGVNSGNTATGYGTGYGQNDHSTRTGAALDPTDHSRGVNSGNTTTGYGGGYGQNDHDTRTGAALDPTDHSRGVNSHTNGTLGNNIGPGPHHTAAADVPRGNDTLYHGHTTGVGATGTGAHTAAGTNTTTGGSGGSKGKEMVGKVEIAVGKVLHSASLVNKGEAKLEQAASVRAQHAELSEAERLENEARLRRERADAHGQAAAGHAGLTQPGVAGPGGPVGLDGSFGGAQTGHRM